MSQVLSPVDQLEEIRRSIQATREEPLHDWVVVAIWDHAGGDVEVYGESDPLELKGYLHSGIWVAAHGQPTGTPRRDMDTAQDVRTFPKGHMDVVRMAGSTVGRATFEPGFRWSESIGPIVGTDTCRLPHIGYVISGRMMISPREAEAYEISTGDAIQISPDHDAWTLGEEPCVVLEVLSAERYGKPDSSQLS
jgi:hypothetical protein